jgi:hypothetical protein
MKRFALSLSLAAAMLVFASVAQAGIRYVVVLSGANENPPTASAGTGAGFVDIDTTTHQLQVNVVFSGLTSGTTASHIHCCIAPPGNANVATTVPSFPGFPLGVTSGTYNHILDTTQASSWNPSFITANGGTPAGAEAALAAGAAAGQAYLNIHTSNFPGGEIRGFLILQQQGGPSGIPTLSEWAFVALGVLLILSAFVYLRKRAT